MLFLVSRNKFPFENIVWLNGRCWFWYRIDCCAYIALLICRYRRPGQIITDLVPVMICEILLDLFCKLSSVSF